MNVYKSYRNVSGFPNVGKSSLINSLKRARACNVGATPGVTKYANKFFFFVVVNIKSIFLSF